jgi:hypothetical protein
MSTSLLGHQKLTRKAGNFFEEKSLTYSNIHPLLPVVNMNISKHTLVSRYVYTKTKLYTPW